MLATGVYGSPLNAGTDWQNIPDDVWVAKSDGRATIWGLKMSDTLWSTDQRIHQYKGGHNETWGGLQFNIDSDVEDAVILSNNGLKNYSWVLSNFDCGANDEAFAVNDSGSVVGYYSTTTATGYLYSAGNCAILQYGSATFPTGINNLGHVVGRWFTTGSPIPHGFLYSNGTFNTIDYPSGQWTAPTAINDDEQIVGGMADSAGIFHGFFYHAGAWTLIDCPGGTYTTIMGINGDGHMVGQCDIGDFLYADGNFTFFPAQLYNVAAINNNDQVLFPPNSIYDIRLGAIDSSLPAPSGCGSGYGYYGINNNGDAVGYCNAIGSGGSLQSVSALGLH